MRNVARKFLLARMGPWVPVNLFILICAFVFVIKFLYPALFAIHEHKSGKHHQKKSSIIHACITSYPAYAQDTVKLMANAMFCTFPRYTPSPASASLSSRFFSARLLASRAVSVSVSSAAVAPPECWKGTTLRFDSNISLVKGLASAESSSDSFLLFFLDEKCNKESGKILF